MVPAEMFDVEEMVPAEMFVSLERRNLHATRVEWHRGSQEHLPAGSC
jgi:hypothetical protein